MGVDGDHKLDHVLQNSSSTWLPIPLDGSQHDALAHLPPHLVAGLRSLLIDPAPATATRDDWYDMAFAAATFAADGWARIALDLGWHPLDLFGCSMRDHRDDRALGVAMQIRSRKVFAITNDGVLARDGRARRMIARPSTHEAREYLWEHGW